MSREPGFDEFLEAEITRRLDELERGQVQTVDADEALRRIDKNLSRRR